MKPPVAPSLNPLTLKERMKVSRQAMPEQDAAQRSSAFTEVNLGYSPELARQEALRCLECAKATCMQRCPVVVTVKEFVQFLVAGGFAAAGSKITGQPIVPAIS